MFISYFVLIVFLVGYIRYTILFSMRLNESILFSKKVKVFHLIMIWIVPFLWIFMLTNLMKSAPGSHQVIKGKANKPFSDAYESPDPSL